VVFEKYKVREMDKYNLSNDTWDEKEINAINEVVKSNRYTMGEKTREYENQFSNKFGAQYAVMVNSGSSANLIAVAALIFSGKLKRGDEVIVPAVSWSTTYFPLQQYGLRLKFVDIDIDTLNIDVHQIEDALSDKTRAIFAVNLLGNPNQFNNIIQICTKYNLLLIEDNCEALGARYDDINTGAFGVVGTYSTFYSHHICTMEGGVAVTDDEELYHIMLSLRAHGWTRNIPDGSMLYQSTGNSFYESFNFILPGYNLRPLEIEAAIGIQQLEKVDDLIKIRRENADYFMNLFSELDNISVQKEIGESSWFGFSIILKNKYSHKRDLFVEALTSSNIEVRPIVAGNFTKNPVIKYFDYSIHKELNSADNLHQNGFFVGNQSIGLKQEIKYLFDVITSIQVH
jgi:CDP-4-dehydro-6-deoxyglucose reductase, E1